MKKTADLIYFFLTLVSNLAFLFAIHVLQSFQWWFLIYVVYIFVPVSLFGLVSFALFWNAKKTKHWIVKAYLGLSLINGSFFILCSLLKAVTLEWGGH